MNNFRSSNFASKLIAILLGAFLICSLVLCSTKFAYADDLKDYIVGDIYATIEDEPVSPDTPIDNPNVDSTSSTETDVLANTGNMLPARLAILTLTGAAIGGVLLYTRRKANSISGLHVSTGTSMATQKAGLVLIILSLLAGTIFASTIALADNEIKDEKAGGRNVASITLNLKLTNDGYVKSAEMDIINKLIVDLQVDDIETVFDFQSIIKNNLPIGEVIPAGASIHKTLDLPGKVDDEAMQEIRNAEGGVFKTMVVTGVHYEGYESHFMMNDGTDDEYYATDAPKGQDCLLPDKTPTRVGYRFDSWNTLADGTGDTVDAAYMKAIIMTEPHKYFAKWIPVEAFLAQASTDLEMPCKIYAGIDNDTEIITVDKVKEAAETVRNGGQVDTDIYSETNDKWHLFVKVSGDGSNINDWMEMRIINVGDHDSDGSAITFQATHGLAEPMQYDTAFELKTDYTGNWSTSSLRTSLNGDFLNSLPSVVSSNLVTTTKVTNKSAGTTPNGGDTVTTNDKVWILSFTEYVKSVADSEIASKYWNDSTHDGSVYGFWKFKNFPPSTPPKEGSEHALTVGALASNRSGYRKTDSYAWERSVSPQKADGVNLIFESGNISAGSSNVPLTSNYIAPSFAM